MGKKKEDYMSNLAATVAGQLRIDYTEFQFVGWRRLGCEMWERHHGQVTELLKWYSLETRAKIAVQGQPASKDGKMSLQLVHDNRRHWLDGSLSGEELFNHLATTAVVAALCDWVMLQRRLKARKDESVNATKTADQKRAEEVRKACEGKPGAVSKRKPSLCGIEQNQDNR